MDALCAVDHLGNMIIGRDACNHVGLLTRKLGKSLSREADALANTQDLDACRQTTLPYGNSVRTLQVDMVAFDSADESIRRLGQMGEPVRPFSQHSIQSRIACLPSLPPLTWRKPVAIGIDLGFVGLELSQLSIGEKVRKQVARFARPAILGTLAGSAAMKRICVRGFDSDMADDGRRKLVAGYRERRAYREVWANGPRFVSKRGNLDLLRRASWILNL